MYYTGRAGSDNPAAIAGFNVNYPSVDVMKNFTLPGSGTDDIANLVDTSNVGVPGLWMFRVDQSDIIGVCVHEIYECVSRLAAARRVCESRLAAARRVCVSSLAAARRVCESRLAAARRVCVSSLAAARRVCVLLLEEYVSRLVAARKVCVHQISCC